MTWEVFEAMCMHEYADMVRVDGVPPASGAGRGRA